MQKHPLAGKEVFIFDLDGTIYVEGKPLPGALEIVAFLNAHGKKVAFLTNNSTKTRSQYVLRLKRIGIKTTKEAMFTSSYSTASYLARKAKGKSIFVIGGYGLKKEIDRVGLKRINTREADVVVVGLDHQFNYKKLKTAVFAVHNGAQFIASNMDHIYVTHTGLAPGGGTFSAAISYATGKKPIVIGKPLPYMKKDVLDHFRVPASQCVMIGDALHTDILAGKNWGMTSVLVRTGKAAHMKKGELEAFQKKHNAPDMVIDSLSDLKSLIK